MYDEEFSDIYDKYGWDYFSMTMGEAILKYFYTKGISIKSNLDLCCGTGTLCNFFMKNGIETKGIDKSKYMIKIAKKNYPNIEFIEKDILSYKSNEKYDLITMTCDAVNHLIGEQDLYKLFYNVSKLIKNNGYFIFDIYDKEKLIFNKEIVSVRDNNIKVYYYITEVGHLINTNVIIKENDKLVYETDVVEKIYNLDQIKELATKFDFEIEKVSSTIMDEKQRFNEKTYIILKKTN